MVHGLIKHSYYEHIDCQTVNSGGFWCFRFLMGLSNVGIVLVLFNSRKAVSGGCVSPLGRRGYTRATATSCPMTIAALLVEICTGKNHLVFYRCANKPPIHVFPWKCMHFACFSVNVSALFSVSRDTYIYFGDRLAPFTGQTVNDQRKQEPNVEKKAVCRTTSTDVRHYQYYC